MNYKVLYRKYRPKTFDDVVGQEYTIKTLRNAILADKISHAYIFTGPRGTGKTSVAKIFSKSINCESSVEGNSCDKCSTCLNIEANADIIEIDAASNNGVDEIREIINNIRLTPSYSKYKVYIIDEVHMLSGSAFNALLLTLEEPPPHVIFILATTEIQNVPITVLSRCQRYDFKRFTAEELKNQLENISKKEKIKITEEALDEIAYIAEGGMRDALSMLDQLIDKDKKNITLDDVVNSFGTISTKSVQELIDYIENSDAHNIISYINKVFESGVNFKVFLEKLIKELKDKAINIKTLKEQSRLTYKEIKDLIIELNNCQQISKVSVNSFGVVELIILDYIDINSDKITIKNIATETSKAPEIKEKTEIANIKNDNKDKKQEIKEKKSDSKKEISSIEDKNKIITVDFIQIRTNNCFVNAKKEFLEETKEKWQAFLKKIKVSNKRIFNLATESDIIAASDSYAILVNEQESAAGLLNNMIDDVEKLFNDVFNTKYKFVALHQEAWTEEKKKYIENIKKGHKYKVLKEKAEPTKTNENQTEILGKDIFGDKLEIK